GGQFLVCGLLALAWAFVNEPFSWADIEAATWPLVYTGVMSVGVAFTAQVVAQRYAHAADAAIILSSETLFAALFGYYLMGDRLGPAGLLGCALIFASMLAVQLIPAMAMLHSSINSRLAKK
uniref:DMT family transporter n=1 Tax=Roseateles sp. TaxID=1971397 RepID=UPI00286C96FC